MPQGKTILLAEDEENDILLIQRAFAEAGFPEPVRSVRDLDELICYLTGKGPYADREAFPFPSLLLLDMRLGGRCGLDALRWLRERPALRTQLVVIALSAVDLTETIESAYCLGVNSYLIKPFAFSELVELARRTLKYWLAFNRLPSEGA
jgi:CheY-like chemotaxis protein